MIIKENKSKNNGVGVSYLYFYLYLTPVIFVMLLFMARLARVVLPGYPHHITQRAIADRMCFFKRVILNVTCVLYIPNISP